jgi:hypothetical protein
MKNATSGLGRVVAASSDICNPYARNLSEAPRRAQSPSKLLAVFRDRCGAQALMVAEGMLPLQDTVDLLQQIAIDQELIDHFGQDEIQAIMADAFKMGEGR